MQLLLILAMLVTPSFAKQKAYEGRIANVDVGNRQEKWKCDKNFHCKPLNPFHAQKKKKLLKSKAK